MRRIDVPAIFDPTNQGSSLAATPSKVVNWLLEATQPGKGRSGVWRKRTPGLRKFADLGEGPIRALFAVNDRSFVVGGATYAEWFDDGTFGTRFSVANNGQQASLASNGATGNQNMICSGRQGYIHNLATNAFQQIIDPNFVPNAKQCEYMDGYFLVLQGGGSRVFAWSKLFDGLTWPGLNFLELSEAVDNVSAMKRSGRYVWFLGGATTEIFTDIGNPTETFAPVPGVFIGSGNIGPFTVQRLGQDETLYWLAANEQGIRTVMRSHGNTSEKVSTFAIDTQIQHVAGFPPNLGNETAFAFQIDGHDCYVITVPEIDASYLYDVSMNAWSQIGTWDLVNGRYNAYRGWCHVTVRGKHYVGDRLTGVIYEMSQEFLNEELLPVPA